MARTLSKDLGGGSRTRTGKVTRGRSVPYARVFVRTAGCWRAHELSDATAALDRVAARVIVAGVLASICSQYGDLVASLKAGYWMRVKSEGWPAPDGPIEFRLRDEYVAFTTALRQTGVETTITDAGARFEIGVDDIAALLPPAARLEVEAISMASPGFMSLAIPPEPVGKPALLEPLLRLLQVFRFWREDKELKKSEVRRAAAAAMKEEAEAVGASVDSLEKLDAYLAKRRCEGADVASLDLSTPLNSVIAVLQDAGFSPDQLTRQLREKNNEDLGRLLLLKSAGLIRTVHMELPPSSREEAKKGAQSSLTMGKKNARSGKRRRKGRG